MIDDLLAALTRDGGAGANTDPTSTRGNEGGAPKGVSGPLQPDSEALESRLSGSVGARSAGVNRPIRFPGLVVREQQDAEGDIVWALEGRGEPVATYSIRSVDHFIRERLTPEETVELDRRGVSAHVCVLFVPADQVDLELDPEPVEVAEPIERLAADLAPVQPELIGPGRTPARSHPWRRGFKDEAAEAAEREVAA